MPVAGCGHACAHGCAADSRLVRMTPFTRGAPLIYDGDASHCAHKNAVRSHVLTWDVEAAGKSRTVTVLVFDEHDRPMGLYSYKADCLVNRHQRQNRAGACG